MTAVIAAGETGLLQKRAPLGKSVGLSV